MPKRLIFIIVSPLHVICGAVFNLLDFFVNT